MAMLSFSKAEDVGLDLFQLARRFVFDLI